MDFLTVWFLLSALSYLPFPAPATIPYRSVFKNRIHPSGTVQYGRAAIQSGSAERYGGSLRAIYGHGGQELRGGGIIVLDLSSAAPGRQGKVSAGNNLRINEGIYGGNDIPSTLPLSIYGNNEQHESGGRTRYYRIPISIQPSGSYATTAGGRRNRGNLIRIIDLSGGDKNAGFEINGGNKIYQGIHMHSIPGGVSRDTYQVPVTFPQNYGGRSAGVGGNIKIIDLGRGRVDGDISRIRGISNSGSRSYEGPIFINRPADIFNGGSNYDYTNEGGSDRVAGRNLPIIEIRLLGAGARGSGGIVSDSANTERTEGTYVNIPDGVKESGGGDPIIRIRLTDAPGSGANFIQRSKNQYEYDFAGTHVHGQQINGTRKNIGYKG